MNPALPQLFLARHGETAWSLSGQHTGLTDLPLIASGERDARRLGQRLGQRLRAGSSERSGERARSAGFARVWTSPLQRAARTCELAGFGAQAEADADLVEWDYGDYEGLTSAQIQAANPGWSLFRDGCPGGEAPAQVAARADRVIARVRAVDADVLLFSSGHLLRMLAARWLALPPSGGALLVLGTASLSVLGYEHHRGEPVLRAWNHIDSAAE